MNHDSKSLSARNNGNSCCVIKENKMVSVNTCLHVCDVVSLHYIVTL